MIGQRVLYWRWDLERPMEPRVGWITGLTRPGHVSLFVAYDHFLDCMGRSMPPSGPVLEVKLIEDEPKARTPEAQVCVPVEWLPAKNLSRSAT